MPSPVVSQQPLLPPQPDIAAPGANILAAQGNSYAIKSGTSMATPHVAGIVALLKALHPNWSPAALKSAIITTGNKTKHRFRRRFDF